MGGYAKRVRLSSSRRRARPAYRRRGRHRRRGRRSRKSYGVKNRTLPLFGAANGPFPEMLKTQVTFADSNDWAASKQTRQYRMNSVYDPNLTGVGIQPRYLDSLLGPSNSTTPYYKYRVYRADWVVLVSNTDTGSTNIAVTCARFGKTIPTTLPEAQERSDTRVMRLDANGSGRSFKMMKGRCYIAPALGMKSVMDDPDNLSAQYNANPVHQVLLSWQNFPDTGVIYSTLHVQIKIKYKLVLFQKTDVADS